MKYHLARGDTQLGTFSDLEVSAGMRGGQFLPTDLCWSEGMKDWQPLEMRMKELAIEAGVPPPLPLDALLEEVRNDHQPVLEPASVIRRLAAKLIDWTLVLVPFLIMFSTLMDPAFENRVISLQNDPSALMEALQKQIQKAVAVHNPLMLAMGWVMDGVIIINVILLTVRGQTIGKLLLRVRIVRFNDGGRVGFLKVVMLRSFLFFAASLLGPVGLTVLAVDALMIFRQGRRCLHDLVADTKVVRVPAASLQRRGA